MREITAHELDLRHGFSHDTDVQVQLILAAMRQMPKHRRSHLGQHRSHRATVWRSQKLHLAQDSFYNVAVQLIAPCGHDLLVWVPA